MAQNAPATVPLLPSADPLIGRTLARTYQIERLLGGGGMGAVYAARHVRTGGTFAVKVLHRETASDSDIYKRFQDEARTVSGLRHPHIVQVTDFDRDDDGTPFIVMEMLEGEDLYQRLCRVGRLPLEQVLDIARQVGSALHAAHEKGIVHRDVKPQNIFLVRNELADMVTEISKVVDFGISKIRRTGGQMTRDMTILGTPQFMSPEAALGQNSQLDGRADQWSLAVILYLSLSGRLPFDGENLVGVLYMVVHERPVPLKQLAPETPDFVIAAIERAMSKRKDDRFPKMLDFVRAVTGMTTNASVRLGPGNQQMSSQVFRVPAPIAPNFPLPQPQVATPPRPQFTEALPPPPGSNPQVSSDQVTQRSGDQQGGSPYPQAQLHPGDVPTAVAIKHPPEPPTRTAIPAVEGELNEFTVPVGQAPPALVATPTAPTKFVPNRGASPMAQSAPPSPPPGAHSGNTPTNIAITGTDLEQLLGGPIENRWPHDPNNQDPTNPDELQGVPTRVSQAPPRQVSATIPLHILRRPEPGSPYENPYPSTLSRATGQSFGPRMLQKLQSIDWVRLRERVLLLVGVVPRSPVRLAVAGGVLTLTLVLLILWLASGSSDDRTSPASGAVDVPDKDVVAAVRGEPDPPPSAAPTSPDAGGDALDDKKGKAAVGATGPATKKVPAKPAGKRIKIDPNL